jgi:hypothetical protein
VWWNAAFVWFRSKGAESKKAIEALSQAIASAPHVYSYLLGSPLEGTFSGICSIARSMVARDETDAQQSADDQLWMINLVFTAKHTEQP